MLGASIALLACGDGYPPCAPEGNGPGTIYGPTPSPLPGPGGPNDPPDWADQPPKYSKTAEGEICTCGPYQPGCTEEPGEDNRADSSYEPRPDLCSPSCGPSDTGNSDDTADPSPLAGGFSPSIFNFVTTIPDDGTDVAGGWQVAMATLKFARWTSVFPEYWSCNVKVEMPLRTALYGVITPADAANKSAMIATASGKTLKGSEYPPGIFCIKFIQEMRTRFMNKPYDVLGARVN